MCVTQGQWGKITSSERSMEKEEPLAWQACNLAGWQQNTTAQFQVEEECRKPRAGFEEAGALSEEGTRENFLVVLQ
jgi:hypothetical protein